MRFYLTEDINGNPVVKSVRSDEIVATYKPEQKDQAARDVRDANASLFAEVA